MTKALVRKILEGPMGCLYIYGELQGCVSMWTVIISLVALVLLVSLLGTVWDHLVGPAVVIPAPAVASLAAAR